jgi:hypothetical protein
MVAEFRVDWTGGTGGDGVTVMHANDSLANTGLTAAKTAIQNWVSSVAASCPNEITLRLNPEIRVLNTGTGQLESLAGFGATVPYPGTGTGPYNPAAGYRIDWQTGNILVGRRLVGRTYVVPAVSEVFNDDGELTSAAVTQINANAQALLGGLESAGAGLQVWSRTHGVASNVASIAIPTKGAILRSRRD